MRQDCSKTVRGIRAALISMVVGLLMYGCASAPQLATAQGVRLTPPNQQVFGVLAPVNGGTGVNSGSLTGCPAVTAGVWTITMGNCTSGASGVISFNGRAGVVTLVTADIFSALSPLTGCTTAGYVYSPASSICITPVTSPGGTSGQTQYNNAGAFGGTAPIVVTSYSGLTAAITAASTNPTTIQIASGLTTSGSLTVPANVVLVFLGGGELNGSGTVTFSGAGSIQSATTQQIFGSSLTVSLPVGMNTYPGWWGIVGDGSTDNHVELAKALAQPATNFHLGCGTYNTSVGLTTTANIIGPGQILRGAACAIIQDTSATATTMTIGGNGLLIQAVDFTRSVVPTGTAKGVSNVNETTVFTGGGSFDSIIGYYYKGPAGATTFDHLGCEYNVVGYTNPVSLYCFFLDASDGTRFDSVLLTYDGAAANNNGGYLTGSPVYAYMDDVYITGTQISDVQMSYFNDNSMTHHLEVNYTGSGATMTASDIHDDSPTADTCVGGGYYCVLISNVPLAANPSIFIGGPGAYLSPSSIDSESSYGVTLANCANCGTFKINGGGDILINNNTFSQGYYSTIAGATGVSFTGNFYYVQPSFSLATGVAVTTTTHSAFNGNIFDGTASSTPATFDAGSASNGWVNNHCSTGSSFSSCFPSGLTGGAASALGAGSTVGGLAISTTTGTVTSVIVTVPAPLTATGCTITTSGTCAITWTAAQTANYFLATPNGTTGSVSLRAIVAADIPTLNQNTTGSAASLSITGQTGLLTFTGLTSVNRTKTVRDAADTILELGGSYTPTGTWTNMTFVTPTLGAATATSINKVIFTAPATTATFAPANNSTFTTSGAFSWQFTVPGAYTYTLPSATSTLLATNGSGSSLTFGTGTLALAGNLTTTGAFNPTLAFPAANTYTFPNVSAATLAAINFAQTYTAVQTFGTNISIGGVTAAGATGTGNVVFATGPSISSAALTNGTEGGSSILNVGGTPTAVAGAGAGTGSTSCVVTGKDSSFFLKITTGTSPTAFSLVCTVSYSTTRDHVSYCSSQSSNDGGVASIWPSSASSDNRILSAASTTGFTITVWGTALTGSSTYGLYLTCP